MPANSGMPGTAATAALITLAVVKDTARLVTTAATVVVTTAVATPVADSKKGFEIVIFTGANKASPPHRDNGGMKLLLMQVPL